MRRSADSPLRNLGSPEYVEFTPMPMQFPPTEFCQPGELVLPRWGPNMAT
jgi:hypothetical protein